jgi:D-alanyl-D-alanine dipeptidase
LIESPGHDGPGDINLPKRFFFGFLFLLFFAPIRAEDLKRPPLIKLRSVAPSIRVDLRYATPNNFTGKTLYEFSEVWFCEPTAHRLARAQTRLEKQGLGLKIWDGYRPLSVQKILWEKVPDDRYVANPKTGSRHNRGASVDVTLVDKNGIELPMPTGFDEFGEKAHRDFEDLPAPILKNRQTLEEAMEAEGFIGLPTEWWHFDDPDWRNFALRDEPLNDLKLADEKKSEFQVPVIPVDTKQLILILARDWTSRTGTMVRFEKNTTWEKRAEHPVTLGLRGLAWGRGLHPLEWKGPLKKEGDKRTPAGLFLLGSAYGPQAEPPQGTTWPYRPITEKWFCVDDPKSAAYNRVGSLDSLGKKDWSSAEDMRRKDALYDWVININQNWPDVKAGCGSCIFFHVWRAPGSGTEGCVAMTEEDIKSLISWLRPESNPVVVILPEEAYRALKNKWALP